MSSEELPSLVEIYEEAGLIPEWLERGRDQAFAIVARNALSKGLPVDVIHDITGLHEKTIKKMQTSHG